MAPPMRYGSTMSTAPLRIDMKGAVPIPVGQHVEIWYLAVDGGLLGADQAGTMMRHVETGILYGPSWAYRKEGSLVDGTPPDALELHESVRITNQAMGRVAMCRIVTTLADMMDQVTTLLIVPPSAAPPYR